MPICCIGDLHLSSDRPWGLAVGEATVLRIVKDPRNIPENTLVLLGDLTEKSVISGAVYSLLMKLFTGLRYKRAYILVGNHDGRRVDNRVDLVYDFLKDPKNKALITCPIEVVDTESYKIIEGISTLFLPHIFPDGKRKLKDYEELPEVIKNRHYGVVFGHFTNSSLKVPGEKIDVSYLDSEHWCFGHIHNPSAQYAGSLVPNSIAEAGQKRHIRTYSFAPSGKTEERIEYLGTEICDYKLVTYPDDLPESNAEVTIWTVLNCRDMAVAKQRYGDIFIRSVVYDAVSSSSEGASSDMSLKLSLSTSQLFSEYSASVPKSVAMDITKHYLGLESIYQG